MFHARAAVVEEFIQPHLEPPMTPTPLESNTPYRCRVTWRDGTHRGTPLTPELLALEGRELMLQVAWVQPADGPHPGEQAMCALDDATGKLLLAAGTHWIGLGDLVVLEALPTLRL